MVLIHRLFALPATLLGLVLDCVSSVECQELEWPYNLPPHVKYYPEDEGLVRRNIEIQQKLREQVPTGMRKMSGDPGEKFMFDYWQFPTIEDCRNSGNASTYPELEPALRVVKHARPILPRMMGGLFEKRAFECPSGSQACTSIGKSDSCCATGSTCQLVTDVGLGDVGCCPGNQVCGGSVSTCPSGGYTDCPQNPGGGCCLPGYACYDVGCVATSTAVVVVTATPSSAPISTTTTTLSSTSPSSSLVSISTTTETTVVVPAVASSTSSSSSTSSISSASSSSPTLIITTATETSTAANTLVCSSGFRSCPVSLGGGCCSTDRACGSDVCPELSSTNSFTAPGRPTSDSVPATTTSTASLTSISGAVCPMNFYACSAYYQGGCCQIGRNCDTTSCPASSSTTVVAGNSITAVAPTGSGITSVQTLLTGSCASGWSTCAADVGGGCCPAGYACGTACTATATGGQNSTVGRIAPNEAGKTSLDSHFALVVMVALLFSITMELEVFT